MKIDIERRVLPDDDDGFVGDSVTVSIPDKYVIVTMATSQELVLPTPGHVSNILQLRSERVLDRA